MKQTCFSRIFSKRKSYKNNEKLLKDFIVAAGYLLEELPASVNQNLTEQSIQAQTQV